MSEPNQFNKLINVQLRSEGDEKGNISPSKQKDEKTSLNNLSGSLWLRQPVEDLRFDLGISFYGFTRCSWTMPTLRKSPFVIRALLAPCAAVAVR